MDCGRKEVNGTRLQADNWFGALFPDFYLFSQQYDNQDIWPDLQGIMLVRHDKI